MKCPTPEDRTAACEKARREDPRWQGKGIRIADDFTGGADNQPTKQQSAASQIIELAIERYHFGVTEEGQPYAVKPGRHVVRMLRGGRNSLRAELSQAFTRNTRKQHRNRH